MGCIGLSSWRFQLWNRTAVTVLLGELLDVPSTHLKLLSDQSSVHVVINNTLTNLDDIVLVKLHLIWLLIGEMMPTKPLTDITVSFAHPSVKR